MILFVSIILTILFILILFIYFEKDSKKHRNSDYQKRKMAKRPKGQEIEESKTASPQILSKDIIFEETGMMIPELVVSESSSEGLKEKVKLAVDFIFSSKKESPSKIDMVKLEDLDPKIKSIISDQIDHLKNFKTTYNLYRAMDDPNISMSDLSKIISTDPVLTGRILKIANSAYFGMQHKVTSIGHALIIIGLLNIKAILYQDGLLKLLKSNSTSENPIINSLWEHLIITSICASHLQGLFKELDRGTLFTLGLLHDIGKLVINDLPMLNKSIISSKISLTELTISDEQITYGVTHAGIGRFLFEQWGFPQWMGKIIESHHDPSRVGLNLNNEYTKYLIVLFLSDQIAKVFSSEDKTTSSLNHLASELHSLINKDKFLSMVLDSSLFSEIRKAKTITRIT